MYRYRPWQSADIATTADVRLGTEHAEYATSPTIGSGTPYYPNWKANQASVRS